MLARRKMKLGELADFTTPARVDTTPDGSERGQNDATLLTTMGGSHCSWSPLVEAGRNAGPIECRAR